MFLLNQFSIFNIQFSVFTIFDQISEMMRDINNINNNNNNNNNSSDDDDGAGQFDDTLPIILPADE